MFNAIKTTDQLAEHKITAAEVKKLFSAVDRITAFASEDSGSRSDRPSSGNWSDRMRWRSRHGREWAKKTIRNAWLALN